LLDAAAAAASPYVVVFQSHGPDRVAPSRVDVKVGSLERSLHVDATQRYRSALGGFAADLTPSALGAIRRDPSVMLVQRDTVFRALGTVPRAAGETLPTGVERIGAAPGGLVHEPSSVNVAVIDTGVDLTHPDLDAVSGVNCVQAAPPDDDAGHGTFVAGVIGARNDGQGIVGVAPGTRVYAVKVLDSAGEGTLSRLLCGIDWVTSHAAALNIGVANVSLGGTGLRGACNSEPLHYAICRSTAAGVVYTVAAGNNARDFGAGPTPDIPAAYPEVLTVTAMTDTDGAPGGSGPLQTCVPGEADDTRASFSDFATAPGDVAHTIAAPGTCVLSTTLQGGYDIESGTSAAAPFAAGVAALCLGEAGAAGPCSGQAPAAIVQ
jgi:subtilisin family serine protease